MCKPLSEGGQRCAAHTRPAYLAARFGSYEWTEAAAQHASTPTGRREIDAQRAELEAQDNFVADMYATAILRGDDIRAANKAIAAAIKQARAETGAVMWRKGWNDYADLVDPLDSTPADLNFDFGEFTD